MADATHVYAIALGSNRRHVRYGLPAGVVAAAIGELDRRFDLFDASVIILNPASGGAGRDFANAVALLCSNLPPAALLGELKAIERAFGRRPGRRWGPRILDLDIVDWDGPPVRTRTLTIPHRQLARRQFVLGPLSAIAPTWRISGSTNARHLRARLGKARRAR
jgi:2-amino-4-hydroxy-6-hydroxymethyldihydropteridine diphosphokinase